MWPLSGGSGIVVTFVVFSDVTVVTVCGRARAGGGFIIVGASGRRDGY